ncbi:torsin-3A isoform X2 [Pseudophryne corroboree]|uniref:torsin-3A isoform X2 n=1 Tax=Pseudophryne corroboree TaxID=495146 RepID=UPI003081D475
MYKAALLLLLLNSSSVLSVQGTLDITDLTEDDAGKKRADVWFSGVHEVQDLAQLSWAYLKDIQCWLWSDKREEKKGDAEWSWHRLGWDSLHVLTDWFARLTEGRDLTHGMITNLTGLQVDLERRIHGQNLAVHQILSSLEMFLQDHGPKNTLVLSFHGWTGTGKNLAARIMAENLYQDGQRSRCTKVFIPQLHFPHLSHLEAYKVQLAKQIREVSSRCAQPLFVFDESDKIPASLLHYIVPLLSATDAQEARPIFIFLSGIGGSAINEVALNFWRAGRHREEITYDALDRPLKAVIRQSEAPATLPPHRGSGRCLCAFSAPGAASREAVCPRCLSGPRSTIHGERSGTCHQGAAVRAEG